jgi:hypothetical protein
MLLTKGDTIMNHLDALASGIEGQVRFGPISPVVRPGMVNYRPYQANYQSLKKEVEWLVVCPSNCAFTSTFPFQMGRPLQSG